MSSKKAETKARSCKRKETESKEVGIEHTVSMYL